MEKPAVKPAYQSVIVEDEPVFAELLKQYIAQVKFLSTPIVCTTAMDALQVVASMQVDILFLDIDLPGMSGIDLIRLLPNPPVVVITSVHLEKAVTCFDLEVADFLPKPYDYTRFLRALTRAIKRLQPAPAPDVKKVFPAEREQIYFKSGRRFDRFAYDDILYIEAYGLYCKVHTQDGVFAISKRISSLPGELPADWFIRIHKSYIINIVHLRRVELKQVWVKSVKLPIGITYRPLVHDQLKKLGILDKGHLLSHEQDSKATA